MQTMWDKHTINTAKLLAELAARAPRKLRSPRVKNPSAEYKKFRQTWVNIVQRCTYPKDKRYSYYSKLGICDEWMTFLNFYDDMWFTFLVHVRDSGIKNTTIDRVNNSRGYSPENCRWATWEQQRANRKLKPVIEKVCLQCDNRFSTKKETQLCCSKLCSIKNRMLPPGVDRVQRSRELHNRAYHKDPTRQRDASKKWVEKVKHTAHFKELNKKYKRTWFEKVKSSPAYIKKQRERYQKLMADPVRHAKMLESMKRYYYRKKAKKTSV